MGISSSDTTTQQPRSLSSDSYLVVRGVGTGMFSKNADCEACRDARISRMSRDASKDARMVREASKDARIVREASKDTRISRDANKHVGTGRNTGSRDAKSC